MKVYELIVLKWDETLQRYVTNELESKSFEYEGPVALCCGATDQQKNIGNQQSQFMTNVMQQASSIFGDASSVFNDLVSTFAPVVAAGPNQEGFSGAEKTALNSQVTEGTASSYSHAAKAVGEQMAAAGGGNEYIPSGAKDQIQADIATSAAQQESAQKLQIQQADYATGRANWLAAAQGLAGATGVFNPATSMDNAATGAGSAASETANEIAQEDNSWVSAVTGALGSVAGAAMTGGMTNLSKGVGFFGQNAPAPKAPGTPQ